MFDRKILFVTCCTALFLALGFPGTGSAQPAGCRNPSGFLRCENRCVNAYNECIGTCDTQKSKCYQICAKEKDPIFREACETFECDPAWANCAQPCSNEKNNCENNCDAAFCTPY